MAFNDPSVSPGDAFDVIAHHTSQTNCRKQGLGTSKIHLTASPKKGTVFLFVFPLFCCFLYIFFPLSSEHKFHKNIYFTYYNLDVAFDPEP